MTMTDVGLEASYKEKQRKVLDLEAENESLRSKLKSEQEKVSKLRKKTAAEDNPVPPTPPPAASPPALTVAEPKKEEPKELEGHRVHMVKGWFPQYCPDKDCPNCVGCSDPALRKELHRNKNFKNETICSTPGCGQLLGEEENVKKNLEFCPNCGGSKYDPIK